jgi:hypothetical protein
MAGLLAVGALTVMAPVGASAAGAALDFGLGFGGTTIDRSLPEIDNSFGSRFNFNFSFPLAPETPLEPLRLGIGLSLEGTVERGTRIEEDDGDNRIDERPYASYVAFSPELKIAWSQLLGERFFIEPSVAVVMPIATYSVGEIESYRHYRDYYDEDEDQTHVGIGVRPAIALGFRLAERHAIGLSFSYLWADVNFSEPIGDRVEAYDVMFFYRLAF